MINMRQLSLVEYIKEKYGEHDQEKLGDGFHEDCLDDHLSLSSHEPLVNEISNTNEDNCDEVLEDPTTPHENLLRSFLNTTHHSRQGQRCGGVSIV
jgi:hypothetical protein